MRFEITPNYIETVLINEESSEVRLPFENGEYEIEMEFYDGEAYPTNGAKYKLVYPKMDEVRESPDMQTEITNYTCIHDSINQHDIALKYGVLVESDEAYIKTTKKSLDLLGETMVILGADLFQALYDMMEESDFSSVASQIRDASIEFEKELDWRTDGTDKRDYLLELERFEAKKLEEWRKIYS